MGQNIMSRCRKVFLVHYDDDIQDDIKGQIASQGYRYKLFANFSNCLPSVHREQAAVVIVSCKMPANWSSSLASAIAPNAKLILLKEDSSVSSAVEAVRQGVFSVVEKISYQNHLWDELELAFDLLESKPIIKLTQAEKRVYFFILEGKSNRQIAAQLYRSVRTIEDHRAKIMKKMGASNSVDLVKQAFELGYISEYTSMLRNGPSTDLQSTYST